MIDAVLQGVMMGLFLSTFCGPIFFMLINLGLTSSIKSVFYLALGTFLSDLIIIFSLLYVILGSITNLEGVQILKYIGGTLLIYFGLRNFFSQSITLESNKNADNNFKKIFLQGFIVNSLNPNILLFWFSTMMVALGTYKSNKELVLTHFLSGLIVSFGIDFLKGYSAFHLKKYITPTILKALNIFSGVVLIGFGLKLIFLH
ncbi:MAG: LysE family transporter [Bacteroidia bacterium]